MYDTLVCYRNRSITYDYTSRRRGSTDINMAVIEYLYTGIPPSKTIRCICLKIMNAFLRYSALRITNPALTVYHGTPYEFPREFKTLAFFSTTTDHSIAQKYGQYVYEIKIPEGFPYIHLQDNTNKQILLPLGTYVTDRLPAGITKTPNVHKTLVLQPYTMHNATNDSMFANIKNIFNKEDPSVQINNMFEKFLDLKNTSTAVVKAKKLTGSSLCVETRYCPAANNTRGYGRAARGKNQANYVIKNILKRNDPFIDERSDLYILSRIMNEMIAAGVYRFYLGDKAAPDFSLVYNPKATSPKTRYYLGSKLMDIRNLSINNLTPEHATKILEGFLVDCIVSNWDVGNNGNIVISGDNIVRIDVGGSLAYRGLGDFKLEFFRDKECKEHITFLTDPKNNSRVLFSACFKLITDPRVIYSKINERDLNKLIEQLQPIRQLFNNDILLELFDKTVDVVCERHNYYLNNQETVVEGLTQKGGNNVLIINSKIKYYNEPANCRKEEEYYISTHVPPTEFTKIMCKRKNQHNRM